MTRISRIAQLIVALAILGLPCLIYPGVMVLFAIAPGLVYVAAAVAALRGSKLASQIAFTLSLATTIIAVFAVLRFMGNGFNYWSGNFQSHDGIYWPPYTFLAVAIGATLVVVLHLISWRTESGG